MIISPYPKPTKCYGDTVIRRYGVLCLFLNKVDYFKALFFNTCLPILKRLTRSPGNA